MTTPRQRQANRVNAAKSTGPKTIKGKTRSAKNDVRHGLRSGQPVLPGESSAAWEAHRDGIRRGLAPAGTLEGSLADRVALCLWRLQRVAGYETAVTAIGLDEAEEEVRSPQKAEQLLLGRDRPGPTGEGSQGVTAEARGHGDLGREPPPPPALASPGRR